MITSKSIIGTTFLQLAGNLPLLATMIIACVAWRIVKDWAVAQMAILESEMVQMDEIFLPYMVNGQGQTLFQAYRSNQLMLED